LEKLLILMTRLRPSRIARRVPRGGFYLWCRLPDGHDSAAISQRCLDEKVVLAPGNAFSASQSATSFLRFNVAQLSDKRIFTTIRKAMERRN
jgi:DNA-binding transcriptional MocR family regulator